MSVAVYACMKHTGYILSKQHCTKNASNSAKGWHKEERMVDARSLSFAATIVSQKPATCFDCLLSCAKQSSWHGNTLEKVGPCINLCHPSFGQNYKTIQELDQSTCIAFWPTEAMLMSWIQVWHARGWLQIAQAHKMQLWFLTLDQQCQQAGWNNKKGRRRQSGTSKGV